MVWNEDTIRSMESYADRAWDVAWLRLFHERTSLFYDFVSSYDNAHRFDHLPAPEEIARQAPNPNGWGSGMEDSTITAGVLLANLCDRCVATGEVDALRPWASRVFEGLRLCGTCSSESGFVLRSVSPLDGVSHYPETSRDQVTHFAHGIWRYYDSPLSSEDERATMREMITALCERLEEYVVPERDYHIGMENGEPGRVDKMWNVAPHEMARLPMVYAVGWLFTGDEHWREMYQARAAEALQEAEALQPDDYALCYALFQHQVSLEVLASLPDEGGLADGWKAQMRRLAGSVTRFTRSIRNYEPVDVASVDMNWRTRPLRERASEGGYDIAAWPPEMMGKEYRPLRELGESLLIQLMGSDEPLDEEALDCLRHALVDVDCGRTFTVGMIYPQAAYWRYRANRARASREETVVG